MKEKVMFPELNAILARKGINYSDLARMTGKNKSTIAKKLSGVRRITVEDLNLWTDVLQLTQTERYMMVEDVISNTAQSKIDSFYSDVGNKKHSCEV